MRILVAAISLAAACGKREAERPPPPQPGSGSASTAIASGSAGASAGGDPAGVEGGDRAGGTEGSEDCEELPFAESTSVPEASGAAWLTIDGTLGLVVVSDSGHAGAFGVLDPDTGAERVTGKLPLGTGAGDDIEGLAARGNRLYGLTSAGFMRVWEWARGGFKLVDGPYPIGDGEDVCDAKTANCGRDYEGLALVPSTASTTTPDACIGVACARADGSLYCLVADGSRVRVDRTRRIPITDRTKVLADCAFSDTGALFVGANLFGLSAVHRVDGWSDPATAKVIEVAKLGTGFPEVVAARGDTLYRMSDTGGDVPSLMARYRCPAR